MLTARCRLGDRVGTFQEVLEHVLEEGGDHALISPEDGGAPLSAKEVGKLKKHNPDDDWNKGETTFASPASPEFINVCEFR